jgi:cyclopropane fatty-acyl-phospholipid synthase-like methyltransferase
MFDSGATVPSREHFVAAYAGSAPWDIGKVQPAFQEAAEKIAGSILDAGCGTGDNALFFASRGHAVTGIDFLDAPIASAKRKSLERGLSATFLEKDALRLHEWSERFDNVIDSGLFHVFTDEDRVKYIRGLNAVLKLGGRLFLLCFSEATPGTMGPRRVTKKELQERFAEGWLIESIEPARIEVRPEARSGVFAGQEPRGWFMIARRAA